MSEINNPRNIGRLMAESRVDSAPDKMRAELKAAVEHKGQALDEVHQTREALKQAITERDAAVERAEHWEKESRAWQREFERVSGDARTLIYERYALQARLDALMKAVGRLSASDPVFYDEVDKALAAARGK